jgi:hypothetical protein
MVHFLTARSIIAPFATEKNKSVFKSSLRHWQQLLNLFLGKSCLDIYFLPTAVQEGTESVKGSHREGRILKKCSK